MNRTEAIEKITTRLISKNAIGAYQLKATKEEFSALKSNSNIFYELGINLQNQPGNCRLQSLNSGIRYQEIEEIIVPILKESEIVGNSVNPNTSWTINLKAESELLETANHINSKLPLELRNENELEFAHQMIKDFYNKVAKPFELKYETEASLWAKIENKNYKEIGSILTSGAVFKYFYLANKFEGEKTKQKFKLWMENISKSKEANPNEIQYKRYWKAGKLLSKEMNYDM